MIIKVTKKHITSGNGTCHNCPVALALRDVVKNSNTTISVDDEEIRIGDAYYDTSKKIADFINRYDEGFKVKPFSFRFKDPNDR